MFNNSSINVFKLFIIIFEFYNIHDTNLIIRYYHIPLKIYNLKGQLFLKVFEFNRFLGIIITTEKFRENVQKQYFSIFSYIVSIDSENININSNTVLNLNQYINSDLIENNIFGVYLYGIKIIKLPIIQGLFYYSEINSNIISENNFLFPFFIILLCNFFKFSYKIFNLSL